MRALRHLPGPAAIAAVTALTLAPAALGDAGGGGIGGGSGQTAGSGAERRLTAVLSLGMRRAGAYSGAEVLDLTSGDTLYAHNADVPRLPASVNKLFTTSAALSRFGASGRLTTTLLATGTQHGEVLDGTLYLRGGGDPTFGSYGFSRRAYGTGATVGQLAGALRRRGIRRVTGSIVADASMLDADKGTPATHDRPSIDVEGALSALAFDRDWADSTGSVYYGSPALHAGAQLADALHSVGIRTRSHPLVRAGVTPAGATQLAATQSPTVQTLVKLTNTPSDNFFAEMLAKDVGARFGDAGSTAAGAAVIRAEMADRFSIDPYLNDGSGLSRSDRTTPAQVVSLLRQQASNVAFTASLAVEGRSGTLAHENRHTLAQGRCSGKTGTLHDVSNVVGYCRARDGHRLAYAFMLNGVYPDYAHPIQNRMQLAVVGYDG